jgi:hypothetical protein
MHQNFINHNYLEKVENVKELLTELNKKYSDIFVSDYKGAFLLPGYRSIEGTNCRAKITTRYGGDDYDYYCQEVYIAFFDQFRQPKEGPSFGVIDEGLISIALTSRSDLVGERVENDIVKILDNLLDMRLMIIMLKYQINFFYTWN